MWSSPRTFCSSPCGHMFEEKRESIMAIEAVCSGCDALRGLAGERIGASAKQRASRFLESIVTADRHDDEACCGTRNHQVWVTGKDRQPRDYMLPTDPNEP